MLSRAQANNVFLRRLSVLSLLDEGDDRVLQGATRHQLELTRGQEIVSEGTKITSTHVLMDGVACRYRMLTCGQRQIVSVLLPGDIVDLFSPVTDLADNNVCALANSTVARIPLESFRNLLNGHPNIAMAVWRYSLAECAIMQGWLSNMRRRSAAERIAYLFCEQFIRLESVGLAHRDRPMSAAMAQGDLADIAGLSSVHVNRTLQQLRRQQLIGADAPAIEILDWDGLRELADFDPAYLTTLGRASVSNGRSPSLIPNLQAKVSADA